jgi:hypothetical protein
MDAPELQGLHPVVQKKRKKNVQLPNCLLVLLGSWY